MRKIGGLCRALWLSPFRFSKTNRNLLCLLALLVCLPSFVFAQADTGSLTGTVRDTSGAVVPDAMVTARNTATGVTRSIQTGNDGVYTFPALPPALYDLTVSKSGFADYKAQATITVGSHVTVDVPLSVSQVSTTVEVVAVPAAEINTTTQEVSQIVSPQEIQNLPSLTRNPYDFIALAGNVSGGDRTAGANPQTGGSSQNGYDRGVGYAINGQRASGTEILLDGAENTNIFDTTVGLIVPQDAVQEFRVITNNFDAQYGRASGGIINLVTKSGTNAFHGDAWEFNRLSAYTANTFDNNAQGRDAAGNLNAPKGQYTRNQFGFDVGGPIKKDKLFFYESTEFVRVRSNASVLNYVPTPQLLALTAPNVQSFFNTYGTNNFSFLSTVNAGDPTLNVSAGGPFSAIPAGTPVFGLVNYSVPADAGGDEPQNTYFLVARADYNLSNSTQMFFRFGRESLAEPLGSAAFSPYSQYDVGQSIYNNNFLLAVNHTFSSNLLSSTKLSFFRDTVANQYTTANQNTPTLLAYSSANIGGTQLNLPGFYPSTPSIGGLPYGGPQNSLQVNEDLSWTKGKHVMRFGGQLNYIQLNRTYGAYAQAIEQLASNQPKALDALMTGTLKSFQVAVDPQGKFPCTSLSYPDNKTLIVTPACTLTLPASSPSFSRSYRYKDWAIYAEDSFRVTPRLTFNYGLRYEHFGVQHNSNPNLDSNFYYGPGANFYQQVRSGSIQTAPNSPIGELWKPRWGTAGPRIGFAYDVFGDGKTSLRGGYGITYERNFGNVTFNMIQNPPAYAKPNITNTPVTTSNLGPFAGSSGSVPLSPVSPRHVDQNIQVAQTQFWSVAAERELGTKAVVALEYNGAHGLHLYDITNINPLGGGQVYLGDPFDGTHYTRPNQQFVSINNRGARAFSHYNALNLKFQTREVARTGLTLVTNYTYAHSLDNLSSTFSESSSGSNGVGNLGYLDPRNVWLDYGNSDFDIRQRLALSMIWNEPFLKSSKGVVRGVASGWSVAPIFTARTGTPFSFSDSTNSLGAGIDGSGIPRYAPSAPISSIHAGSGTSIGANNFNLLTLPAANSFADPVLGISDFGPYPSNMTSRNQFYGPGAWSFDLALAKNFFLTERFSLEFRAEGFDIFNHVNMFVNGYNNDVANFATGVPLVEGKKGGLGTAANGGGANHDERRFGQFALRLHF